VTLESLLQMDIWLSNLLTSAPKATLNSVRTQAQVIAAKPADAFDLCYLTGDATFSTPVTDMALCDADPRLVMHSSPRQVAGGPLTEDILKCQLKPLNPADYAPATLTASQLARLNAVFPGGVCDWSLTRRWPAAGSFAAHLRRRALVACRCQPSRFLSRARSIEPRAGFLDNRSSRSPFSAWLTDATGASAPVSLSGTTGF
jgi:hypothetical protein